MLFAKKSVQKKIWGKNGAFVLSLIETVVQDAGMKTLIALDDQEELIDKFEAAADGINQDMALAEKALKVGFQ